jgi:hypothetical protein
MRALRERPALLFLLVVSIVLFVSSIAAIFLAFVWGNGLLGVEGAIGIVCGGTLMVAAFVWLHKLR